MESSRLNNSIKNLLSGFLSRFIINILGLVVRTVFIRMLGNEYLSINGLYSNILNMLSLAELGFGTAMVYSMYKPLAEHNNVKLAALMDLYRKVYRVIGFVVLGLGLCVIPFMDYIIKDPPNVGHLTFYYVIFLINTVLSYWFFAYKRSILIADQKEYICANYHNVFNIVRSFVQIIILILLHNFTLYLLIQMGATILENIAIAHRVNKVYPVLKEKNIVPLTKEELKRIGNDVKGLMLSRIAHVVLNSTDNIIISSFVGITWVGLLSNFTLIVDSVTGVLCQITSALSASLGNYFVKKSKDESYQLFERVEFMNSWLYGFCAIALFVLLNPFVTLWIGVEYTMSTKIVFALSLNFFVQGYMNTLWTFRSTLGLFTQGWFRPIIVAGLNIFFSVLLGIKLVTFGVLIATFISRALVNLWFDPWIIHKYGFKRSVKPFYRMYLVRVLEIVSIGIVVCSMKWMLLQNGVTVIRFALLMGVTCIIMAGMFWLYSRKRDEYTYFKLVLRDRIIVPILNKRKKI